MILDKDPHTGLRRLLSIAKDAAGNARLDDYLLENFGRLIREGNTLANSARVLGVRARDMREWQAQGAIDSARGVASLHSRFVRECERALGDQERQLAAAAMACAERDGKTALEILARRNPTHWAPAAPQSEELARTYGQMQEAELRQEIARLEAMSGADEPKLLGPGDAKVAKDPDPIVVPGVVEP